jgi:uncharacterized protein DUF3309
MAATQSRSQADGASDVAMQPEPPTFLTASEDHWRPKRKSLMSIGTIILIILIIALLGGFSGVGGGPFYGTGYYGGSGLGLIIVILLILILLGRI